MKAISTCCIAASLGSFLLSGCSLLPSKKPPETSPQKPAATAPELVGRIASIPPDKRFVLIQSYGKWKVATGTILTTRGTEERTANLLATGESLGEFAAADIQSGTLEVGDAVYSRHVPAPPILLTTPEAAEDQSKVESESVQKNN